MTAGYEAQNILDEIFRNDEHKKYKYRVITHFKAVFVNNSITFFKTESNFDNLYCEKADELLNYIIQDATRAIAQKFDNKGIISLTVIPKYMYESDNEIICL